MAENTNSAGPHPRVSEAQDSITRPANTTAYAAGDAISDNTTATAAGVFTLDFKGGLGAGLTLLDFTLHKSVTNLTLATFGLLLFDALPAVAGFNDNSAVAITDAEMKNCKGSVTFAAADWIPVGTGDIQTVSKTIAVIPASDSSTLYGVLTAVAGYTPASGEVFTLTVHPLQD